ncbi:MAG: hypothetical protein H6826_13860 [Planctomycetes bacterium]|nr:hypothetical protein [Planctomycetota bacterium]MCB9902424.1 hypothetical protein [Planctomycetota bacterium]
MSETPTVFVAWDPERGHSVMVRLVGILLGASWIMGSIAALYSGMHVGFPLVLLAGSTALVLWGVRRGPHIRIDHFGVQRPRWNEGQPLSWKEIEGVLWDPRTDALTVKTRRPARSLTLRVSRYEFGMRARMRAVLMRYLEGGVERRVGDLPSGVEHPAMLPAGTVLRPEHGPLTWGALGFVMIGGLAVAGFLATGSVPQFVALVAAGLLLLLYTRYTAHIRVAPLGLEVRLASHPKPLYVGFSEIKDIRRGASRGLVIYRKNAPRLDTALQVSALTFARLEATVLDQALVEVFA